MPEQAADTHATEWPRPSLAWTVIFILTLVLAVAYVERQVISLLVPQIKDALRISDTRISLLQGAAFSLFYSSFGLVLGRAADSLSRRNVLFCAVLVSGVMTCLCGLSSSYNELFLSRVGVGIGEAALGPAALSLIADCFPPRRLPFAIGVYHLGSFIGISSAYLLGGELLRAAAFFAGSGTLGLESLAPWQLVFVLVGLPGVVVALPLILVKEPRRQHGAGLQAGDSSAGWREVLHYMLARWRIYAPLFGAFTLTGLSGFGIVSWVPTMLVRSFGWTTGQSGVVYGAIFLVFASGASVIGGYLCTRVIEKGRLQNALRVSMWNAVLFVPAALLATLGPNVFVVMAGLVLSTVFLTATSGLPSALVQILTPNWCRGRVMAVYYLILTLGGLGLGPTVVALLTDYVFRNEHDLRYSLATLAVIAMPLAVCLMALASRAIGKDAATTVSSRPGKEIH
ncbi:MAG: MFS transporter [Rhizomicrobium sp.]